MTCYQRSLDLYDSLADRYHTALTLSNLADTQRATGDVQAARQSWETALRLLTVNGAWLTFEEDRKGPLLPGYFADIAVLSGNPLTASAEGLLDIRCQATMVGGRWVHGITA